MKAEHVNAFLVPAVEVLQKMSGTEVQVGKVSLLGHSLGSTGDPHLSILIGLKGRLSGSVILAAARPVAESLTARILKSPEAGVTEDDVRAVMAEVANTVVGNATGLLYDLGIKAGITPPTVVLGMGVRFGFDGGVESVQIPLETPDGKIYVVVSLTRENP